MVSKTYSLDVRDPIELVRALISELGPGGHLSLEGDLSRLDKSVRAIASSEERAGLRRNTLIPQQDFIVLPLDDKSIPLIEAQVLHSVGLRRRVIHVQIEQAGELVFGAYDDFHPECVWVSEAVGADLLERMVAEGILRSFKPNPHSAG
jgi:hypothetical protein